MITDLLALLLALATGAVAGILITVWHAEHRRAKLHAHEAELPTARALLRGDHPRGREPSALVSRDRLPI